MHVPAMHWQRPLSRVFVSKEAVHMMRSHEGAVSWVAHAVGWQHEAGAQSVSCEQGPDLGVGSGLGGVAVALGIAGPETGCLPAMAATNTRGMVAKRGKTRSLSVVSSPSPAPAGEGRVGAKTSRRTWKELK